MELDTNIALQGKPVVIPDQLNQFSNAMKIRGEMLQNDALARQEGDTQTLNDIYRGAIDPTTGKVNRTAVLQGAAGRGLGSKIPGLTKQFQEEDTAQSTIDMHRASASKTRQEILYSGLKHIDNAISSLVSDPEVNDMKVMSTLGNLVRLGAFDEQARMANKTPDELASEIAKGMPINNPVRLKQWLTEAGMRNMDATKRVEIQLPKYDEQDRGGVLNQGTINQVTGIRTPITDVNKSPTPGDLLKANNDKFTVQQAADGTTKVIDTNTGTARTVVENGVPIENKDSPTAKNRQMAYNFREGAADARELLKNTTGSGTGAVVDNVLAKFGLSTQGGDNAQALEAVSGWLTANVPRFEGPQSDGDRKEYRSMAAAVGDRSLPVDSRIKALDRIEKMMAQFESRIPGTLAGKRTAIEPGGPRINRPTVPYKPSTPVQASPGSPVNPHANKTDAQIRAELGI